MEEFLPHTSSYVEVLDLQQQVARLQALLEASRQVHSTIALSDVLRTALQIAVRELEVPGAATTEPRLQYGEMPAEPWTHCVRYPIFPAESGKGCDLVIACARKLTLSEDDFLEGLVLQTAVAAQNARFHERDIEWARVQQDLDAARVLQRSLLPEHMPKIPGFDIAVRSSTCFEVGGDYIDLIEMPGGKLIMIVADVAGKGLASAIVSTAFRAAFRAFATSGLSLKQIAESLNQQHWEEGPETRRKYVTALLMRLDPAAGVLETVNAGHNPGFLLGAKPAGMPGDAGQMLLKASGAPLGILPDTTYVEEHLAFPPGSRLLIYTDGLTEVFQGDEEYGEERLLASFANCANSDSVNTLEQLWAGIREFSGVTSQVDDMTALTVYRMSNPSEAARA